MRGGCGGGEVNDIIRNEKCGMDGVGIIILSIFPLFLSVFKGLKIPS
jgi:hypothetical protein